MNRENIQSPYGNMKKAITSKEIELRVHIRKHHEQLMNEYKRNIQEKYTKKNLKIQI